MTFDPLCSIRRMPVETALATTLLVLCTAPLGVRCVATFTCGNLLPWLHFPFSRSFAGGVPKGEGKSNVLGIPLFLFLFLAFLLGVPKGTLNLRKREGKGKAS